MLVFVNFVVFVKWLGGRRKSSALQETGHRTWAPANKGDYDAGQGDPPPRRPARTPCPKHSGRTEKRETLSPYKKNRRPGRCAERQDHEETNGTPDRADLARPSLGPGPAHRLCSRSLRGGHEYVTHEPPNSDPTRKADCPTTARLFHANLPHRPDPTERRGPPSARETSTSSRKLDPGFFARRE